ncbi:hypothetical protein U1872_12380 [Sphingomonas sp. RB3P16]|uniref:hypothetical protein n=1 Tax=Parasphingomonas frigoris TaxID=3096163 RepID=UPI002FC7F4F3
MSNPSGPELAREIVAYRNRLGVSETEFSRASGISAQTICSLKHSAYPTARTIARVRDFIAAHYDGFPPRHVAVPPNGRGPGMANAGAAGLVTARAASIAPARPSISDAAAREADEAARRRAAARSGSQRAPVPHALPADAAPAEILATGLIETPADLITRVRSAWPELWAGVVRASRARGEPAGATLMQVISRGLEGISA